RRWLRDAGLVWRRPRPTPRPKDPDRQAKLDVLRQLLGGLPDDETAVFMDEVDVHLNPKVGCMWMRRGQQAAGGTPGTNEKRCLAAYPPDCKPTGRVWWRLHEGVARNHRCGSMEELLQLTFEWFSSRNHFRVKGSVYEAQE